jgi:hypothetical protein
MGALDSFSATLRGGLIVPPEPHSTPNRRKTWEHISRALQIVLVLTILGAVVLTVFRADSFRNNLHNFGA